MIREATPEDTATITAFLQDHVATSMFLLSNLEQHGIGRSEHLHATRFFMSMAGSSLKGVFGCTRGGYLMCQHPELQLSTARAYLACVEDASVQGMTGTADQVALFLDALPGLQDAWLLNRVEPLFALDLAMLDAPNLRLARPAPEDRTVLEGWFESLLIETGIADALHAPSAGALRAATSVEDERLRICHNELGTPVGMTSVNARAGRAVQIGGVFVLPEHRGQGIAGRMVGAQLAELREAGAELAFLFAASDAAARAYTRIGFQRRGSYRVAMLRAPSILGAIKCP